MLDDLMGSSGGDERQPTQRDAVLTVIMEAIASGQELSNHQIAELALGDASKVGSVRAHISHLKEEGRLPHGWASRRAKKSSD